MSYLDDGFLGQGFGFSSAGTYGPGGYVPANQSIFGKLMTAGQIFAPKQYQQIQGQIIGVGQSLAQRQARQTWQAWLYNPFTWVIVIVGGGAIAFGLSHKGPPPKGAKRRR